MFVIILQNSIIKTFSYPTHSYKQTENKYLAIKLALVLQNNLH